MFVVWCDWWDYWMLEWVSSGDYVVGFDGFCGGVYGEVGVVDIVYYFFYFDVGMDWCVEFFCVGFEIGCYLVFVGEIVGIDVEFYFWEVVVLGWVVGYQ